MAVGPSMARLMGTSMKVAMMVKTSLQGTVSTATQSKTKGLTEKVLLESMFSPELRHSYGLWLNHAQPS